jgi:hypothetical protein
MLFDGCLSIRVKDTSKNSRRHLGVRVSGLTA